MTILLVAIAIVGGGLVYTLSFSTAGTISSSLHVTIAGATVSASGGVTVNAKNDGSLAWDANVPVAATISSEGTPLACTITFPSTPVSVAPGATVTGNDDGTCAILITAGDTYSIQVTVAEAAGSSSIASTSVVATS